MLGVSLTVARAAGRPAGLPLWPLRRRSERPPAAGADDEHPQRWLGTRTPTSTCRSS
ncbi:hypothetical protein [Nocardioides sp.]|uniref:hypothetical protein n=1 Tax=Nocardioides sp. TaxID=35761 RepID=UPI0037834AB1